MIHTAIYGKSHDAAKKILELGADTAKCCTPVRRALSYSLVSTLPCRLTPPLATQECGCSVIDAMVRTESADPMAILISHGTVHGSTVAGVDWVRALVCILLGLLRFLHRGT